MHVIWSYHLHFSDLSKYKKFGTVTWTISNNFFLYFFPSNEFHVFGLNTNAPYFKSRFMKRWNIFFSCKFIHYWCLTISLLAIKSISHHHLCISLHDMFFFFFFWWRDNGGQILRIGKGQDLFFIYLNKYKPNGT